MILQRLQFPPEWTQDEHLYVRYNNNFNNKYNNSVTLLDKKQKLLLIGQYDTAEFNTYFNSFSYQKWATYTIVEDIQLALTLQGVVEITFLQVELGTGGDFYTESVVGFEMVETGSAPQEFIFDFPHGTGRDILAFRIKALENSTVFGGAYLVDIEENSLPEINIALCICTYKREDYIKRNLKMLDDNVFGDENSIINGHIRVYISDNAKTLDIEALSNEYVKIIPNLNGGGAAGFARGMIEALSDKEKYGITHFMLMDDDIVFTEFTLERIYNFLRLLKAEYRDNVAIGGQMINLDKQFTLNAAGETYNAGSVYFNKQGYNLFVVEEIIKVELEESINHLAWWLFTCPADLRFLPLPLFFQYDDIDVNIRNSGMNKITFNGACVWHEPFDKKISFSKEYYAVRNRLITSAVHGSGRDVRFVQVLTAGVTIRNLFYYRYQSAELMLRAVTDFLCGLPWLASQNPDELNKEIMSSVEQLKPVNEFGTWFNWNTYKANFRFAENKRQKFIRRITLNGMLLPAKNKSVIVPINRPSWGHFYRAKQVFSYDENARKGFLATRSLKKAISILFRLLGLLLKLQFTYKSVAKKYKDNYPTYITEDFWRGYLGLEIL